MRIGLGVLLLAVAAVLGLAALTVDEVSAANCYKRTNCDVAVTACAIHPTDPDYESMYVVLGDGATWDPSDAYYHGRLCAQVYWNAYGTGYCDTAGAKTGCYLLSGWC